MQGCKCCGSNLKAIRTNARNLGVNIPRDRDGSSEPVLPSRHSRRFGDQIAMYACDMSTRGIGDYLHEQYGVQDCLGYVSFWVTVFNALTACGLEAEQAEKALQAFEVSESGQRCPAVARPDTTPGRWWCRSIVFRREIRRPTNRIEGLNCAIGKVIKPRALFPRESAAKKLIFLAIRIDAADWKRSAVRWSNAMSQFTVMYGERFTGAVM